MLPCCSIMLVYHACAYDASNHSELTSKTSTHLAFSALKWFEKVRGGSRGLNHSETVYRYPTHLVTTVKMRFEKVRYSRTTPNSRQRLLRACVTSRQESSLPCLLLFLCHPYIPHSIIRRIFLFTSNNILHEAVCC